MKIDISTPGRALSSIFLALANGPADTGIEVSQEAVDESLENLFMREPGSARFNDALVCLRSVFVGTAMATALMERATAAVGIRIPTVTVEPGTMTMEVDGVDIRQMATEQAMKELAPAMEKATETLNAGADMIRLLNNRIEVLEKENSLLNTQLKGNATKTGEGVRDAPAADSYSTGTVGDPTMGVTFAPSPGVVDLLREAFPGIPLFLETEQGVIQVSDGVIPQTERGAFSGGFAFMNQFRKPGEGPIEGQQAA